MSAKPILNSMAVIAAFSCCLQGATSATNTSTVSPTLKVNATVQTAVQLTLATGSTGSPCTISAGGGGDYSMSFGNVNGLGTGSPTCGVVASTTSSGATYATSYQLTATYSGFSSTSGTVVTLTSPGFTHSTVLSLAEGSSTAGPFIDIPNAGTTVTVPATSSGAVVSRALALTVASTNGGTAFAGADSAIVTFTLTVQ